MSIQVIEPAKWLAGRFAAAIHLVHVYESGYQAGLVVPAPPFSLTPYEQEAKERVGGALNALAHKFTASLPQDAMSSAALRRSTKSVGWQAKLAPTSLSCPRMDELAWSICFLAARPSERCGTRRVRCLSCANGAMASPKRKLVTKRSLCRSISPVARVKDCGTRSDSRGVSERS